MVLAMAGYLWVQSLPRRVMIFTLPAEDVRSADQSRENDGVLVLPRLRDPPVSRSRRCRLSEPQRQARYAGRYLLAHTHDSFLDAQCAKVGAYP